MVQIRKPSDAPATKRAAQSTFSVLERRREIGLRRRWVRAGAGSAASS